MKLREYRESHVPGLTQRQLAEELGVTDSLISRYESEDTIPSTKMVAKLYQVTRGKVTIDDFVPCQM